MLAKRSGRAHERVAERYGVPFVAYEALLATPPGCGAAAWGGVAHRQPPARARARRPRVRALALVVRARARADARRAGRAAADGAAARARPRASDLALRAPPHASPELARRLRVCARQRSVFDPARCGGEQPRVVRGNWSREEPRLGAWGWGTSGPRDSEIEFPLRFGHAPRATIVYTRSYESFGDVVVSMRGGGPGGGGGGRVSNASFVASGSGFEKQRATQTSLLVLNVAQAGNEGHAESVLGFGVAPHSNASLVFRFVSDPPLVYDPSFRAFVYTHRRALRFLQGQPQPARLLFTALVGENCGAALRRAFRQPNGFFLSCSREATSP